MRIISLVLRDGETPHTRGHWSLGLIGQFSTEYGTVDVGVRGFVAVGVDEDVIVFVAVVVGVSDTDRVAV